MRQRRVEARAIADRDAWRAFARALEQAREDAAGAELDEEVALFLIHQLLDRLGPAHGAGDLVFERFADFIGIVDGRGVGVADDGDSMYFYFFLMLYLNY